MIDSWVCFCLFSGLSCVRQRVSPSLSGAPRRAGSPSPDRGAALISHFEPRWARRVVSRAPRQARRTDFAQFCTTMVWSCPFYLPSFYWRFMGPILKKYSTKVCARGVWSASALRALLNVQNMLDTLCRTQLTKKGQKSEFSGLQDAWETEGREMRGCGGSPLPPAGLRCTNAG